MEDSLRGKLLIASPTLLDPNFARTVLFVTEHNDEGAMGIVLNRPSESSVESLVPQLAEIAGGEPIYVGGPVQPDALVLLADFSNPEAAAWIVVADVGLASADVDLEELADSVRRGRVYAGSAEGTQQSDKVQDLCASYSGIYRASENGGQVQHRESRPSRA